MNSFCFVVVLAWISMAHLLIHLNSFSPGRCSNKSAELETILRFLEQPPVILANLTGSMSTLVQAMAWCRQANVGPVCCRDMASPYHKEFAKHTGRFIWMRQCYSGLTRTTRTPAFWDTPRCPMITQTSDSHQIPSENKTKLKLQILKNCEKSKFSNFARNFTRDTPSEVVW